MFDFILDGLIVIDKLNEWQFYVFLFTGFTFLGFLSGGRKALKWSKSHAVSLLSNFTFLKLSVYYSGLFIFFVPHLQDWYNVQGFPQVPREFWDSMPLPIAAITLLLAYDFSVYWTHRLLHTSPLWPSHAVHHSDTDMNFLSFSRGHPVEQVVIMTALVFGTTWVGIRTEEIVVLFLLRVLHQHYVHANLDWDHGPFHYLLVSPRFHRWHHVDHPDAYDKNFASIFPFYDKMFGTYYNPHSATDMPTGIGEHTPGHNIVALTTWPFMEWGRMIGAKLRSSDETLKVSVPASSPEG